MSRIRRIMHASDFSKASRRAFATAMKLAAADRTTVTLVHVVVPLMPLVPEQNIDALAWQRLNDQARRWARKQLAQLAQRATRRGLRVTMVLLEGDPAQQIVRAARSKRADLLVIGTHGRRGFSKLFLGSVAGRVIATATCPVVTVRET